MKTWILYQRWGLDLRSAMVGRRVGCSSGSAGKLLVGGGVSVVVVASWWAMIVASPWRA